MRDGIATRAAYDLWPVQGIRPLSDGSKNMDEKLRREHRSSVLREYANGKLGTKEAIENAGLQDFADLLIVLSQENLLLPKPEDTPERRADIDRARAILQPLLRAHGD